MADFRTRRQNTKQTRIKEKTKRRKNWRDNITRRREGRQAIWMEKIKQKGASGYYTPEAAADRMDFAKDLIGTVGSFVPGLDIDRRDQVIDVMEINGMPATNPSGGGGGGGYLEEEEEIPMWQNPMVIGGVVVGGFLLYKMMGKK